jgi:addiction module HigA family antidote
MLSLSKHEGQMRRTTIKSPVHPGSLLKDEFDALGLSMAAAAEALGVTRQQLYKVASGASAVTPEMAVRIERAIGGSADMWLRMQAAFDLARARRTVDLRGIKRIAREAA